jgi:hypothetical protein
MSANEDRREISRALVRDRASCRFLGLDEVICFLRPQYEDQVIEIIEIATECDIVILTGAGFSNIYELDDRQVKGWCEVIIDACRP